MVQGILAPGGGATFEQRARSEASFATDCNSTTEARNWVEAKRSRMVIHLLHETCVQPGQAGAIDTTIICQGAQKKLQNDVLQNLNARTQSGKDQKEESLVRQQNRSS